MFVAQAPDVDQLQLRCQLSLGRDMGMGCWVEIDCFTFEDVKDLNSLEQNSNFRDTASLSFGLGCLFGRARFTPEFRGGVYPDLGLWW